MYRVLGSGSLGLNVQAHCRGFSNSFIMDRTFARYTVSLGTEEGWEITEPWPLGLLSFLVTLSSFPALGKMAVV